MILQQHPAQGSAVVTRATLPALIALGHGQVQEIHPLNLAMAIKYNKIKENKKIRK